MNVFTFSAVQFVTTCGNWQDAIRLACQPLEALRVINPDYTRAIIDTTEEHGPWYILTPGFAMPHARPEDGVLSQDTHLSLLRIQNNVAFEEHGAVGLLIVLAAGNGTEHLVRIQQLTQWLEENARLDRLLRTSNEAQLLNAIY